MTTLIIARHGNTFNPGETPRRVGGRTNLALSESGLMQATALGRHLAERSLVPDLIFSSQQRRALQTAALAGEELSVGIPIEPLAIFNELDYGPDENMPEDVVLARIGPQALKDWDERAVPPPGWQIDPPSLITAWIDFGKFVAKTYTGRIVMVVTSNGTARFAPHITGDFERFRSCFPLKLSTGAYGLMRHDGTGWSVDSWNRKPS